MKRQKTINYILIIIFIFVLYVPTISYFFLKDTITTENVEKRKLAERPSLNINNITSFPKQFDDYYNDHLPYRSYIVNNWRNLHYTIFDESEDDRVIVGKNENNEPWLFYDNVKKDNEISFIDGRKELLQSDLEENLNSIKEQTKLLKSKNIDLYYIVCPNKSTIYSDYLPRSVDVKEDYFTKVYSYLKDNGIKNIFYSVDILKDANKKYETYYRTDTHWNNYGAYVYIKDIINKIYDKEILKDEVIDQTFYDSSDRDLHSFMGISVKIKENKTDVSYYNKKSISPKRIETNNGFAEVFENKDYLLDEIVLLIGDSFTTASARYFISIYKTVVLVQFNRSKYDESLIDKYQPSKLFYLRVERSTPKSINFELMQTKNN